jgi:hypothetical protein
MDFLRVAAIEAPPTVDGAAARRLPSTRARAALPPWDISLRLHTLQLFKALLPADLAVLPWAAGVAACGFGPCYHSHPVLLPVVLGGATLGGRRCYLQFRGLLFWAACFVLTVPGIAALCGGHCYFGRRALLLWAASVATLGGRFATAGSRSCYFGRRLCYFGRPALLPPVQGVATLGGRSCSSVAASHGMRRCCVWMTVVLPASVSWAGRRYCRSCSAPVGDAASVKDKHQSYIIGGAHVPFLVGRAPLPSRAACEAVL